MPCFHELGHDLTLVLRINEARKHKLSMSNNHKYALTQQNDLFCEKISLHDSGGIYGRTHVD